MKKIAISLVMSVIISTHTFSQDFSNLYENAVKSVVTIQVDDYEIKNGGVTKTGGLGSGVLIDSLGHILTASHVVHNALAIKVKFQSGEVVAAQIVSSIPSIDVALLKLESIPKGVIPSKTGNSETTKIGEQIFIIGAPLGFEYSFSTGHISGRLNKSMLARGQMTEFFQTDDAINQGTSGGPMFNSKGEVIGIVSFILSQSGGFEGIGFAVAITPAKKNAV